MDPISIIGGLGNDYMMKHTGKSIEMDLFEIFFQWGVWGILCTYGLTLYYVKKTIKVRKYQKHQKRIIWLFYTMIAAYSILGGHLYGEPLSETFLLLGLQMPLLMENKYDKIGETNIV